MSIPISYPFAKKTSIIDCSKKDWGWQKPMGITIHDSADRNVDRVISWLNHEKLGYHLIIDRDGSIIQTSYFDKCINHAGTSLWKNLSPNRHHIAICLMSWGKLTKNDDKYIAWNGSEIKYEDVVNRIDFLGNQGYYDKSTNHQEDSLIEIVDWFVSNGIDSDHICGHDECCIPQGRKTDPGGILSFSVESLRQKFKR